jgi:hypothetical protein
MPRTCFAAVPAPRTRAPMSQSVTIGQGGRAPARVGADLAEQPAAAHRARRWPEPRDRLVQTRANGNTAKTTAASVMAVHAWTTPSTRSSPGTSRASPAPGTCSRLTTRRARRRSTEGDPVGCPLHRGGRGGQPRRRPDDRLPRQRADSAFLPEDEHQVQAVVTFDKPGHHAWMEMLASAP